MDFLTPEVFNTIIVINLVVGLLLAAYRFRLDMTRPLPSRSRRPSAPHPDDDTQPTPPPAS